MFNKRPSGLDRQFWTSKHTKNQFNTPFGGRLAAAMDVMEVRPDADRDKSRRSAPWQQEGVLLRGQGWA
jgi:hypothetical protein